MVLGLPEVLDAAALVAEGFALTSVTLVDMFPDTHHVEVVSLYSR